MTDFSDDVLKAVWYRLTQDFRATHIRLQGLDFGESSGPAEPEG